MDQGKLFRAAKKLLAKKEVPSFPDYEDKSVLVNDIGKFFIRKTESIRSDIDKAVNSCANMVLPEDPEVGPEQALYAFHPVSEDEVQKLVRQSAKKPCPLDPAPTSLVVSCLDVLLPVITRIINCSLTSGDFPECWKEALVSPLLKKSGVISEFTNLRPVSNLQYISKLTERAVFDQTHAHLTSHGLYPPFQSAYRKCHSTETALLKVQNDILMNLDSQRVTLLVMLDLSAALDTVDHGVLLNRLSTTFGVRGSALQWFASYLLNRSQRVSFDQKLSENFKLQCGVPQGSCLGPLLFTINASKLFEVIKNYLPHSHAYADDTQLYLSFNPDLACSQNDAVEAMEQCIQAIRSWMIKDKLRMNDSKTEFMIIGTRKQLTKVNIDGLTVGESSIVPVTSVRNLGSWFDQNLSMIPHINKICKAASFHIYNIRRIRKYLTIEAAHTLVHSIVIGSLDYCNSLLCKVPAIHISKLQRIQNSAARLVCSTPRFNHITPVLFSLHWLPVTYRIEFKILVLTFKAIYQLAPSYICNLVRLKDKCKYQLRSSKELLLQLPIRKTKKTLGDRSFQTAAPVLWNSLPASVRDIDDFLVFKRTIKTYLFRKAFACYC